MRVTRRAALIVSMAISLFARSDAPLAPADPAHLRPAPLAGRAALVVEDDPVVQAFTCAVLTAAGVRVDAVERGDEALHALEHRRYDIVYLDLNLPGADGLRVLAERPPVARATPVVVVTSEQGIGVAVEAMKRGAADYLLKPATPEALVAAGAAVLAERAAPRPAPRPAAPAYVGASAAHRRLLEQAERVAPTRAKVLLSGEPGAGKGRLARLIHELSPRAHAPLLVLRCAALPEARLEAALLGAPGDDGAWVPGVLEAAAGGTLLLDEIGALPLPLQRRLVRALHTRQLPRGPQAPATLDLRLLATTSRALGAEAAAGRFDQDLLLRLTAFPITVPPLRERAEDVAPLTAHFLAAAAAEHGLPPAAFADAALARMAAHRWPGNVRELRTYVTRAALLHAGHDDLPFEPQLAGPAGVPAGAAALTAAALAAALADGWDLARLEREYILTSLTALGGHQSRTAARLGIDRRTLYRKLREYEVRG